MPKRAVPFIAGLSTSSTRSGAAARIARQPMGNQARVGLAACQATKTVLIST
jgi:hypothetical protein